jgi:hypothetical protein
MKEVNIMDSAIINDEQLLVVEPYSEDFIEKLFAEC